MSEENAKHDGSADRLEQAVADFKAIARGIEIDMGDPGKLLVAAHLFDRARDLAERGADEANRQAESLILSRIERGR